MGCDNSTAPEPEIDVDWFLVKNPNVSKVLYSSNPNVWGEVEGIGYYFFFTDSSNITDLSIEEMENESGADYIAFNNTDGILLFSYDGENFSFDLSDSYLPSYGNYLIETNFNYVQRIIYHADMNYFTIFDARGGSDELNSLSPNELIDYR